MSFAEGGAASAPANPERWLVALDVDGTVMLDTGEITDATHAEISRLAAAGHEVTLATGRSVSMTLPVLDRLGIAPEFVVCANGAITLGRDPDAPLGYRRVHVESFVPREVLTIIRAELGEVGFAVENELGELRVTGAMPTLETSVIQTDFESLLDIEATRVVVVAAEYSEQEFLATVERMGLHSVAYNVGWTAWLDIAPFGVNKATALTRVRDWLGVPGDRVLVAGDGRNDVEMLHWAAEVGGVAVGMGQAPPEVLAAANTIAHRDHDDGLPRALAAHLPG